jgi:hypothetical protein
MLCYVVGNLAYASISKEQVKENSGFWKRNIKERSYLDIIEIGWVWNGFVWRGSGTGGKFMGVTMDLWVL